jgi:hypothetical protein
MFLAQKSSCVGVHSIDRNRNTLLDVNLIGLFWRVELVCSAFEEFILTNYSLSLYLPRHI